MDVLIIHYNTQELTEAAIMSLWKHTPECRVTVFDNSDKRPFGRIENGKWIMDNVGQDKLSIINSQLSIIDNTRGQVVNWDEWLAQYPNKLPNNCAWGSAKHTYSVEICLDRFPNGVLLMDSDVLLKKDVTPLCDPAQAVVAEIGRGSHPKRGGLRRFMPMICWLNVPMLRQAGATFFNPNKMWALTDRQPHCWYDTGAWLLETVLKARLPYRSIEMANYVEHFGHGSWKNKHDPNEWLRMHRQLWI